MLAPLVRRPLPAPALLAAALLVALLPFAAPTAHAQARAPFTLEQVLSAPFASDLVASADGARVAWVVNAEGARNVWVADAPEWRGRQLTRFQGDDGQGLGGLQFTPDGQRLVFTRGGAQNRAGEFPNPASDPEGPVTGFWVAEVDGAGEPRRLAGGGSPAVSPRGDVVAFTRGDAVLTLPLAAPDGGEEPAADTLLQVRSGAGGLTWSPDGARLALVSRRGGHSFVGVYDLAAGTLTWMAPSLDQDAAPAWSPDGRRIAFLRERRDRDRLPFTPQREALPWGIVVADAATGQGREVWTAPAGAGSAFYGVSGPALMWAAGDRLVFPYERSGWLHLWSLPAAGGEPVDLTPGEHEVQSVALSLDRRHVLFDSNQGDIDRKHVWRVPADGSRAPAALTPGPGLEWAPVDLRGGAVAFVASTATLPARAEVLVDGRRRELAPGLLPESFPDEHLTEPRQVVFPAADGMPIHGQLWEPPARCGRGPHPGLLFFHGGSRRQMLLGFHPRGYYHNAYAFNQFMAARCYVVMSVNYRSGIGYGMEFREAIDYGAQGASEFNDVLGAGLYLAQRPDVDAERIGLWGGSYGGYLTALGLARASDLFAAGVDLHGVHDWNMVIQGFRPDYDPTERPEFARLALQSSPIAYVDTWRSPVLLIHGDDDRNVPFSESVDLAEDLRRHNVPFEQLVFPDEVHGFLLHRSWLAAYRAAADFLDRQLMRDN